MTDNELKEILENHKHWINEDVDNWDLLKANLSGADLSGAKNAPYIPMVCPEEGEFYGWKKAKNKIIKLKIPPNASRSSATTRKCRCNKAYVIEIYELDGSISETKQISSNYDKNFIYEVGKTVEVKDFDKDRWVEYTRGIHFFMNKEEAIKYAF